MTEGGFYMVKTAKPPSKVPANDLVNVKIIGGRKAIQLPVSSKITHLSKNSKSPLTRRAERLNSKLLNLIEN